MEAKIGTYPCDECNCKDIMQCCGCESNTASLGRFDTLESIAKIPTEMEKVKS